jgi:hypothetical protein
LEFLLALTDNYLAGETLAARINYMLLKTSQATR